MPPTSRCLAKNNVENFVEMKLCIIDEQQSTFRSTSEKLASISIN